MLDGVLDERLQENARHGQLTSFRINIYFDRKSTVESRLLDSARRAYNEKNYPFAITRFRDFLAKFGGHRDVPQARYGLGLASYELGSAYQRQAPLERMARGVMDRLVDQTGHNAHLAVLHGRDVLYVIEQRAPGRPLLVTDVGVRLPAALTASG